MLESAAERSDLRVETKVRKDWSWLDWSFRETGTPNDLSLSQRAVTHSKTAVR